MTTKVTTRAGNIVTRGLMTAPAEAYLTKYHPKFVQWVDLEPESTVKVTVIGPVSLPGSQGVMATYRRDTNFSGSLSEAVKVIDWTNNNHW